MWPLANDVPLPVSGEIHALATLHCQRRNAVHLIPIGDAAVKFDASSLQSSDNEADAV